MEGMAAPSVLEVAIILAFTHLSNSKQAALYVMRSEHLT
jgi:hypothetical protein